MIRINEVNGRQVAKGDRPVCKVAGQGRPNEFPTACAKPDE